MYITINLDELRDIEKFKEFFSTFDWSRESHNIGCIYSGSIAKNIHFGEDVCKDAPVHPKKINQPRDIDLGVLDDSINWIFELMQEHFPNHKYDKGRPSKSKSKYEYIGSYDRYEIDTDDIDSYDESAEVLERNEDNGTELVRIKGVDVVRKISKDIDNKWFTKSIYKFGCPVSGRNVEIHLTSGERVKSVFSYSHGANVNVTSLYTFIMGSLEWKRPKDIWFLDLCRQRISKSIPHPMDSEKSSKSTIKSKKSYGSGWMMDSYKKFIK